MWNGAVIEGRTAGTVSFLHPDSAIRASRSRPGYVFSVVCDACGSVKLRGKIQPSAGQAAAGHDFGGGGIAGEVGGFQDGEGFVEGDQAAVEGSV